MKEPSVIHNTFVIERNYPKTPAQVFAAFADATRRRRWFAEGDNHEVEEFKADFRVGGDELLRYRFKEGAPLPNAVIVNEGSYHDIVPDERIVMASKMSLGNKPISASLVTIELLPNNKGTDLICTHQGAFFENSGGPEMRKLGWQKLLESLAKELAR
jgi:uncharacterized protein YndB with AHSA1/START domain